MNWVFYAMMFFQTQQADRLISSNTITVSDSFIIESRLPVDYYEFYISINDTAMMVHDSLGEFIVAPCDSSKAVRFRNVVKKIIGR